jgi:transcriptional regulator with XRE-family HTH domain
MDMPPTHPESTGAKWTGDGAELRALFGRRVRMCRRRHDVTQEELAEDLGLSPEYVSRIERGLASPSFDVIAKLAQELLVEPKDLFDFSSL